MVYICAIKPGMGLETDKREIQKGLRERKKETPDVKNRGIFFASKYKLCNGLRKAPLKKTKFT